MQEQNIKVNVTPEQNVRAKVDGQAPDVHVALDKESDVRAKIVERLIKAKAENEAPSARVVMVKGDTGAQGERGERGEQGIPGISPHIGENGNWFIGDTDTGVSAKGFDSIQEIELAELTDPSDFSNLTDLVEFTDKSGAYVVKNTGVVLAGGEPITVLFKGTIFTVWNMKDLAAAVGEVIPDEDNYVVIKVPSTEGHYDNILVYIPYADQWERDYVSINNINIQDYVPQIDTSSLIGKYVNFNSQYGVYFTGSYVAVMQATQLDIRNGVSTYKPITPANIDYMFSQYSKNYAPTLEAFNTLNGNVTSLQNEIEQILSTVVTINE